ncbi:MAG: NAD-dependent epimerase/dehydratase family protein [Acidobacteria bacterium]|nr:MAG: NAD-dependent epimerase/dehydratase family protein [Acidobacteriota bacterium]
MILLTGSSGYLGSRIAHELVARGEAFRVLVRNPERLGLVPAEARCEIMTGDLLDRDAVAKALRGTTHVIHSAALVKMWVRDRRDFWRVNVDGLKSLLEAADRAGVERVVYTSSFMAAGPSSDPKAVEGLKNHGPYSNEYEETKARALDWLRTEGFAKFPVVALLPGVVYGPGPPTEGNLVGGMMRQFLSGRFPGLPGSGEQRWSFAYISEVVQAHLTALDKGRPGEEYFLAGDNRSLNDLFNVIGRLAGVNFPVRRLPFAFGKAFGALEVVRARLYDHRPQLTPGVVEIFKHDWVYSSAKACRELGYRVVPLEEGIQKTLEAGIG